MNPRDLSRRLTAVERQLPTGQMVSTSNGAGSIRPFQVGFAAKLTSAFDPSEGYSWERLYLDVSVPEVGTGAFPQAGKFAFTPDNNERLAAGAVGWLEIDAQAAGYLFLKDAAGLQGPDSYACGLTYSPGSSYGDGGTVSVDLCGIAGDRSVTALVYVEDPGDADGDCSGSGGSGSGSGLCAGLGVDLEVATIEEQPLIEDSWISLTTDGKLRQTNSVVICYTVFNAAELQIDTYFGDPVEEYTEVDLCNVDACCAADPLEVSVVETSGGSGSGFGCDYAWTATPSGGIPPYTYSWDAGDGTTGDAATFEHSFSPGTWTVTLVVYDSCGQRYDEFSQTVVCEDGGGCGEPSGCEAFTVAEHTVGAVTIPEDTLTRACWTDGEVTAWWWQGANHTILRCGDDSLCLYYPALATPLSTPGGCGWASPDGSFSDLVGGECVTFTPTTMGGAMCGSVQVCCGPPIVTECCEDVAIPSALHVTLGGGTGGMTVLDGKAFVAYYQPPGYENCDGSVISGGVWYGEFLYDGFLYYFNLVCPEGGLWTALISKCLGGVGTCTATQAGDAVASCDPFSVTGTLNNPAGGCYGGTGTINYTVVP